MSKKSFSNLNIKSKELVWKFSQSKGPGGQKVNKTDSKVLLIFNVKKSRLLSDYQKLKIRNNFKGKLMNDSIHIVVQTQRAQYKNRQLALSKVNYIINECLKADKKIRKATQPTSSSINRRLINKKLRGEIKKYRKSLIL